MPEKKMDSVWRSIPDYPGYLISDDGRVAGKYGNGRILRAAQNDDGYDMVALCRDGICRTFAVHRLMALAFYGPSLGRVVRHLDGTKSNRLDNLRYGTASENMLDAVAHGTQVNTRKTHCPQGHPYAGENLRISAGKRTCRTCRRAQNIIQKRKKREHGGQ